MIQVYFIEEYSKKERHFQRCMWCYTFNNHCHGPYLNPSRSLRVKMVLVTAFRVFNQQVGAHGLIPSAVERSRSLDLILLAGEAVSWDGRRAPPLIPGPCCWSGEDLSICCREAASKSNSLASSAGRSALGLSASSQNSTLEMFVQSNTEKWVWEKG